MDLSEAVLDNDTLKFSLKKSLPKVDQKKLNYQRKSINEKSCNDLFSLLNSIEIRERKQFKMPNLNDYGNQVSEKKNLSLLDSMLPKQQTPYKRIISKINHNTIETNIREATFLSCDDNSSNQDRQYRNLFHKEIPSYLKIEKKQKLKKLEKESVNTDEKLSEKKVNEDELDAVLKPVLSYRRAMSAFQAHIYYLYTLKNPINNRNPIKSAIELAVLPRASENKVCNEKNEDYTLDQSDNIQSKSKTIYKESLTIIKRECDKTFDSKNENEEKTTKKEPLIMVRGSTFVVSRKNKIDNFEKNIERYTKCFQENSRETIEPRIDTKKIKLPSKFKIDFEAPLRKSDLFYTVATSSTNFIKRVNDLEQRCYLSNLEGNKDFIINEQQVTLLRRKVIAQMRQMGDKTIDENQVKISNNGANYASYERTIKK
jgi:hypothetical protein